MVGYGLVIGCIVLVIAVLLVLRRRQDPNDDERRTIEDTIAVTKTFERAYATVTYTNGREERLEYDEIDDVRPSDEMMAYTTFDEDCFSVGNPRYKSDNHPVVNTSAPRENKQYINHRNVQNIDIEETERLEAVANVPVDKEQRSLNGDRWHTDRYSYDTYNTEYDFEIRTKGDDDGR